MKLQVKLIDGHTIEVEGAKPQDLIEQAAFWSEISHIKECPICKSAIHLYELPTKDGDMYYGYRCTGKVRHQCSFGQKKKGGLFLKREWVVFDPPSRKEEPPRSTSQPERPQRQQELPKPSSGRRYDDSGDDIPF